MRPARVPRIQRRAEQHMQKRVQVRNHERNPDTPSESQIVKNHFLRDEDKSCLKCAEYLSCVFTDDKHIDSADISIILLEK